MSAGNFQKKWILKNIGKKRKKNKKERDQGFLFPTGDIICTLDLIVIRDSRLYDFKLFQVKIQCLP